MYVGVCVGHEGSCLVGLCGLQEDTSRDRSDIIGGLVALDVNAPMGGGCWFGGMVSSNVIDSPGVIGGKDTPPSAPVAKGGSESVTVAAGSGIFKIPSYASPPG